MKFKLQIKLTQIFVTQGKRVYGALADFKYATLGDSSTHHGTKRLGS
jgi:hypothetical protein